VKVLIADKFEKVGIDGLEALGCTIKQDPALEKETLPAAIAEFKPEALIVRSTKVPAEVISGADSLKLIIRAGAGTDNIDSAAAKAKGIGVCNCPGMNAIAVAELAMGHILSWDRRLPEQNAELKKGHWFKKEFSKAKGIKGSTLGIVGVGHIGGALVKRAKAFEMDVIAWSPVAPTMTDKLASEMGVRNGGTSRQDLLKMLGECDVVSIHVALVDPTKGMCDSEFFGAMKDGALFVNTSRGGVVDDAALLDALEKKGLRVGVDVYNAQPASKDEKWSNALVEHPNVHCTHHIGASTDQAQAAVAEETVRVAKVFKESGTYANCVNGL
jgi:D-3-phosphoglycerate dehydrogenase